MATNMHILLLYTLSLKLELVCHLVLPKLLLTKRVFHFWIAFSGVEQCDDKHHIIQYLKVLSKNGKPSFLVKLLK